MILFLGVILINIFRLFLQQEIAKKMVTFQNAGRSNDWEISLLLLINLKSVHALKGPKLIFKWHIFQGMLFRLFLATWPCTCNRPGSVTSKDIYFCKWCGSSVVQNMTLRFGIETKVIFQILNIFSQGGLRQLAGQLIFGRSRSEETPPAEDFCSVQKSCWLWTVLCLAANQCFTNQACQCFAEPES